MIWSPFNELAYWSWIARAIEADANSTTDGSWLREEIRKANLIRDTFIRNSPKPSRKSKG
jgi:hypothetical protein